MLSKFDDFKIHQTPEPVAVPATSDRNAYDRTWFNGYAADGSYYFGLGVAIYPHRGVLDCATWRHGVWRGELEIGYEACDLAALDLLQPENVHVQQVVRASDGAREGIGVLEQSIRGPYSPGGFITDRDGAGPGSA